MSHNKIRPLSQRGGLTPLADKYTWNTRIMQVSPWAGSFPPDIIASVNNDHFTSHPALRKSDIFVTPT